MSPSASALLLTKASFDVPRDGGTLRVAAISHELSEQLGLVVRAVAVEEVTNPVRREKTVSRRRILVANLRVLSRFIRIGSASSVRWYRPRVVREIMEIQALTPPDVRIIEYSQLLGYRPIFAGPIVLGMHNIESELMANYAVSSTGLKSVVARYEAKRIRRLEASVSEYADIVSVVSEHDRQTLVALQRRSPPMIVVAPNGVADGGFLLTVPRGPEVVFVAHLGWTPNVDAAEWLCERVWPLVTAVNPHARLNLVGRSPSQRVLRLSGPSVTVHADVESVLPFVARAAAATAPLQSAGGTRLKILEALSCGTPVVATSLGALGLEHLPAPALQIADGPELFAEMLCILISSPAHIEQAREAVEPYRWRNALSEYVATVRQIVQKAR